MKKSAKKAPRKSVKNVEAPVRLTDFIGVKNPPNEKYRGKTPGKLPEYGRWAIIKSVLHDGKTPYAAAKKHGVKADTVTAWVNRVGPSLAERKHNCPARVLTPNCLDAIKQLLDQPAAQRLSDLGSLQRELAARGFEVPIRTLRRGVRQVGGVSRVMPLRPGLTAAHVEGRKEFIEMNKNAEWRLVCFQDQSAVSNSMRHRRELRLRGASRTTRTKFQQSVTVHVWGAISYWGKSPIVILPEGETWTSNVMVDIAKKTLIPWLKRMDAERRKGTEYTHARIHVQRDNAKAHMKAFNSTVEAAGFNVIWWPSNSPDFNIIENVWGLLKDRIRRRLHCERQPTRDELARFWEEEWDALTLEEIRRLFDTMPRRLLAAQRSSGWNTPY